jgi:hypothetical protein
LGFRHAQSRPIIFAYVRDNWNLFILLPDPRRDDAGHDRGHAVISTPNQPCRRRARSRTRSSMNHGARCSLLSCKVIAAGRVLKPRGRPNPPRHAGTKKTCQVGATRRGMKVCPPKPGLTVMTRTRSICSTIRAIGSSSSKKQPASEVDAPARVI